MTGREELESLHTALLDAQHGYETAVKDATSPELKAIFQRMHDLHGRAHAEAHKLLTAMGKTPDESGSFMSTVHETVIGARSALVGLDDGSLSSFASGEEHTLAKYDAAIGALAGAAGAEPLTKAREELAAMIAEMKRRADG